MKYYSTLLIPIIIFASCGENDNHTENEHATDKVDSMEVITENTTEEVDSISLPDRVVEQSELILGQVDGDLDKDGVAEKVVVFARDLEWESTSPRDLVIYKQKGANWEEWVVTQNAISHADEGGMMGDPFGDIQISNGVLHISHFGGSSWKWGRTDKFRFQDGAFYLIGYSSSYGKPCEYWEEIDYNLSTGDCVFNFEPDVCEDYDSGEDYGPQREEKFKHKMDKLPTLNNRRTFEYEFVSPKGEKIYL